MIATEAPTPFVTEEWPHGLRCADCESEFFEGQRIYRRAMEPLGDGTPCVLIVCEACEGMAS